MAVVDRLAEQPTVYSVVLLAGSPRRYSLSLAPGIAAGALAECATDEAPSDAGWAAAQDVEVLVDPASGAGLPRTRALSTLNFVVGKRLPAGSAARGPQEAPAGTKAAARCPCTSGTRRRHGACARSGACFALAAARPASVIADRGLP